MNLLDLISGSILNTLGCDMQTFVRYFPVAQTMYDVFVAVGIGLLLLNCVWQLVKNFGLGIGIEAEDPFRLVCKTVFFLLLIWYSNDIVDMALEIGGTPYQWIVDAEIPALEFASFMSVISVAVGNIVSGSVVLISLILLIVIAWNYVKLLLEAAERYVLLGVLVFTAPVAFSLGAAQSTSNIFKSWCRMLAGQIFLLSMNAWCLKLFTNMVGHIISNPLDIGEGGGLFIWFLVALGFLKVSQKIDSFMGALGISVGHTGGSMLGELFVAAKAVGGIKKLGMLGGIGGKGGQPSYTSSGSAPSTGFFAGGLSGMVSRKAASSTASNLAADAGAEKGGFYSGLGSKMYESSVGETGGFASRVVGSVATGSVPQNGMITGEKAMGAFEAYMGPDGTGIHAAAGAAVEEQASEANPAAPIPDQGIPMSAEGSTADVVGGSSAFDPVDGSSVADGGAVYDTIPTGPDADISYSPGSSDASVFESSGAEGIPASSEAGGSVHMGAPAFSTTQNTVVEDAGEHRGTSTAYTGGYGAIPSSGASTYRDIAMGGGRITGVEMNAQYPNGIEFSMYHAGQFQRPEGSYTTVTSRDGEKWYKQYAVPAVERTPVSETNGKVKQHERIVRKLPKAPPRHGR